MRMKYLGWMLSLILASGCSSVTTQDADQITDAPATREAGTPTPGLTLEDDIALQEILEVAQVILKGHSRIRPPRENDFIGLVVECSKAIKNSSAEAQNMLLADAGRTARDINADYYMRVFSIVALGLLRDVGGREAAVDIMLLSLGPDAALIPDERQLLKSAAIAAAFPDVPDHTDPDEEADRFFRRFLVGDPRVRFARRVTLQSSPHDPIRIIGSNYFVIRPDARRALRLISHPKIQAMAIRLSKDRRTRGVGIQLMSVLKKDQVLESEAWRLLAEEGLSDSQQKMILEIIQPLGKFDTVVIPEDGVSPG